MARQVSKTTSPEFGFRIDLPALTCRVDHTGNLLKYRNHQIHGGASCLKVDFMFASSSCDHFHLIMGTSQLIFRDFEAPISRSGFHVERIELAQVDRSLPKFEIVNMIARFLDLLAVSIDSYFLFILTLLSWDYAKSLEHEGKHAVFGRQDAQGEDSAKLHRCPLSIIVYRLCMTVDRRDIFYQ